MQDLVIVNNKELEVKATDIIQLKEAEAMIVIDKITMDMATIMKKVNDELLKEIDDTFDPIISKANATHKEAIAKKKKHSEIPLKVKKILTTSIGKYLDEEKKKAGRTNETRRG